MSVGYGSIWKRRVNPASADGWEEVVCLGEETHNGEQLIVARPLGAVAGGRAVYPSDLEAEYDMVTSGQEPPTDSPRPLEGWGS